MYFWLPPDFGGAAPPAPPLATPLVCVCEIPRSHLRPLSFPTRKGNKRLSENKVTRMMRVEAPRQFLPNVRSSGLAFRLALAKG